MTSETCPCGHPHSQHIIPTWCSSVRSAHAGEVGMCRYYDNVITHYRTVRSTTYDSDSDDDVGWRPSVIHHNYGGNSAPYVANSYSTTHGNTTWITPRGGVSGGYSYGATSHESREPVWGKKYCASSCGECRCKWCLSDAGQAALRAQRESNRIAEEARVEALRRAEAAALEERKRWREATFRQRCRQRGVIRAIARGIKEAFVCGCARSKNKPR